MHSRPFGLFFNNGGLHERKNLEIIYQDQYQPLTLNEFLMLDVQSSSKKEEVESILNELENEYILCK